MHPLEGKVCGNYVIQTLLDQGGVGLVFIGQHRFLDERVAIKILHDAGDAEMGRRFFQEAKATRTIDHPNVVRIIDFGQEEKGLYLVMELLSGESVAGALERGPLDEASVARIGAAVAGGLQAAHAKGIIHRDLKPGNIFLCSDGQVKLLDFGLAKVKASADQTAAGIVVGTPQYMAPEQVRQTAKAKLGPWTDIYGFGAVLFRMLTGRLPFVGKNLIELLGHHLNSKPPRPSSLAKVSEEMDDLVLQCMEKNPEARPASIGEVRVKLLRIVERWKLFGNLNKLDATDSTLIESGSGPKAAPAKGAAPFDLSAVIEAPSSMIIVEEPSLEESPGEGGQTLMDMAAPVLPARPAEASPAAPQGATLYDAAPPAFASFGADPGGGGEATVSDGESPAFAALASFAPVALPVPPPQVAPAPAPGPAVRGQPPRTARVAPIAGVIATPSRAGSRRWMAIVIPIVVVLFVGIGGGALLYYWTQRPQVPPSVESVIEAPAPKKKAPVPPPPAPGKTVPAEVPEGAAPAPVVAAAAAEGLRIESDPAGAQVFANHAPRGITPLTLDMPLPLEIKLTLPGHKTVRRTLTRAGTVRIKLTPE